MLPRDFFEPRDLPADDATSSCPRSVSSDDLRDGVDFRDPRDFRDARDPRDAREPLDFFDARDGVSLWGD